MEIVLLIAVGAIIALLIYKSSEYITPDSKNSSFTELGRSDVPASPSKSAPMQTSNTSEAMPPPIPASKALRGRAHVIDGDTIVVQRTKVRLAGIDAPELDKPWGQKSKWEMVRICKGEILDVKLTGETSYDRLVGTCYLSDGRDVGAEMVRSGLALDGGYYSKGKYRHLEKPGMRAKLIRYGHRGKGLPKK